ncbi:NlpC/P60 family protein [Corynebacterium pseudodiphtheriticum]|uniref:C40 family peptidase n=1 Tax=Corynebacterium pseudodiphtheriticum TaxID=37637 RepID=UPI00254E8DB5|nr:C40 family peptidase [Corynebacterium pseudodiphtheriticum]MDK8578051.1 NlpC/P60 family protein [Corynebacterium pseudodiphtheriticum]
MAKHRKQNVSTKRRVAAASAAVVGSTMMAPGMASAAQFTIPNTNFTVDVPGVENIPGADQLLGSSQAPAPHANPVQVAHAPVVSKGQQIVDAARSAIGSPYAWGAAGPGSFDCSGLTSWAYQQAGVNIPRTSQAQAAGGTRVSLDALQPGDIIAYYGGASHVGIYTGHGTIIDALNAGSPVGERPLHFQPIHSAVRF